MATERGARARDLADEVDEINISEPEVEEVVLEGDDAEGEGIGADLRYSFLGRFIFDGEINQAAMKKTLATVWRPRDGVFIKEWKEGSGIFLFQFFHPTDAKRVEDLGPWSFDNHLLVLKRIEPEKPLALMDLNSVKFWVRVYDLPIGTLSDRSAKQIGDAIGNYVESDPNNFGGLWRSYLRLRTVLDVRRSLKGKLKVRPPGATSAVEVQLKYERLPLFCFVCRILGHGERFCPSVYANPEAPIIRKFSNDLRVLTGKQAMNSGCRWLREAAPAGGDRARSPNQADIPRSAGVSSGGISGRGAFPYSTNLIPAGITQNGAGKGKPDLAGVANLDLIQKDAYIDIQDIG